MADRTRTLTPANLSTAAAAAQRDKLRATPRIQGSGPSEAVQHDRALAGRSMQPAPGRVSKGSERSSAPAPGASNANRPRLKMPGGGDAA